MSNQVSDGQDDIAVPDSTPVWRHTVKGHGFGDYESPWKVYLYSVLKDRHVNVGSIEQAEL